MTYKDLERYSRKAMSTWGNVRHFKHFLPRLLELSIDHRDDFLDLAALFGKLKHAQFNSWPHRERDAVNRFFDEYWQYQLDYPKASGSAGGSSSASGSGSGNGRGSFGKEAQSNSTQTFTFGGLPYGREIKSVIVGATEKTGKPQAYPFTLQEIPVPYGTN